MRRKHKAAEQLVYTAARYAGLTVHASPAGFGLADVYGTLTEPLTVADVLPIAGEAASTGLPVIS